MLDAAESQGLLKPGGTIVEPTSGNTGTGLAMAAAIRGYRCILVMPDKMSKEKIDLLRAYGADVVVTPSNVSPDSPESYYGVANRLASEIPGAFQPNQFHNHFNPDAHYHTTGPEIWRQTNGTITHFVAGRRYRRNDLRNRTLPKGSQSEHSRRRRGSGGLDLLRRHSAFVCGRRHRHELSARDGRPARHRRNGARFGPRLVPDGAPDHARRRVARRRLLRNRRRRGDQTREDAPKRGDRRRHPSGFRSRLHVEDLQRRLDDRQRFPARRQTPRDGRRRAAHEDAAAAA